MSWCLVSREYPPKSGGGIGTYAASFARALADRGERVVVVSTHAGARSEAEADGVTVIRLPLEADERWAGPHGSIASDETRRLWREVGPHSVLSWQVAGLVPELIERFGVRVIEGCETGAPLWHLLEARAASSWSDRVRVMTHVHSPSAWIEPLNRRLEQGRWMHELQRRECEQSRWSDGVVAPSSGMARWVGERWGVRASVIRYPFLPAAASEAAQGDDVLFVGRLEYRKGIDTLAQAWPMVETDARLRVVGRDVIDYRTGASIGETWFGSMPRGARGRVQLHGALEPGAVAEMQRRAAVIVVPSPDDNFPFTCIEAMSAGRVVVAADAGGASEMIEHGVSGLLFAPGDAGGLAGALSAALGMTVDARCAMGEAAAVRIGSLCDAGRVVDERLAHAEGLGRRTERSHSPDSFVWGRDAGEASVTGGTELSAGWALRSSQPHDERRTSRLRRIVRRLLG